MAKTKTKAAAKSANSGERAITVREKAPAAGDKSTKKRKKTLPSGDTPVAGKSGGDEKVVRALELELQSTKERLQTTLEGLETSKEELQSINEELRTVNNELSNRVDDLTRANNDLKNLFANTRIAMLFLDRNFNIMNFTPPAKELFRLREHDLGRPMDELAGRIDHAKLKDWVRAVTAGGKPVEEEVRTNGEGSQTFLTRIMPYRDEEDRVQGAVLTFVDITERKHHEQQLSAMVSELNHRVKNSVAAVQAMVRRTEPRAASVEEFGKVLQGSLQAMSTAYHVLSAESWQRADMEQLAADILTPFATPGGNALVISGPTVDLQPKFAVALGLILFELATNAGKYGAWSGTDGTVNLNWEILRTESGRLTLNWTEKDGPPVTAPQELGYGLKFVRDYAAYELDAECAYEFAKEGFAFRLEIPADPVKWRARDVG